MAEPVNLADALAGFADHWSPKTVAAVNDMQVKVVKVAGTFVWHTHEDTDELFLVIDGVLRIELRGRAPVTLEPGELFVVPRGVEHRPVAAEECHVLLLEPAGTVNTGDAESELTAAEEWL